MMLLALFVVEVAEEVAADDRNEPMLLVSSSDTDSLFFLLRDSVISWVVSFVSLEITLLPN